MLPATIDQNNFITNYNEQFNDFIRIPKTLLQDAAHLGLTPDDVLLYSILRARADYSILKGWVNKDGEAYVVYTRYAAAKELGISLRKIIGCFRRLVAAGLIVEYDQVNRFNIPTAKRIVVREWHAPSLYNYEGALTVEAIKNGALPFVTASSSDMSPEYFYSMPRLILEHPLYRSLSVKQKLLYTILLDGIHRSIKFGDYTDSCGRAYCTLSSKKGEELLQCTSRTMTSLFKSLTTFGLIERYPAAYGEEWHIYVRDYVPKDEIGCEQTKVQHKDAHAETHHSERTKASREKVAKYAQPCGKYITNDQNSMHDNLEESTSYNETPAQSIRKNITQISQTMHSNVEESTLSASKNMRSSQSSSQTLNSNLFKSRIAQREDRRSSSEHTFDLLALERDLLKNIACAYAERPHMLRRAKQLVVMAMDILRQDVATAKAFIRFGQDTMSKSVVLAAYHALTPEILQTLFEKIIAHWDDVKNLRRYLHRSLVSAAEDHEAESYYVARGNETLRATPKVEDTPIRGEGAYMMLMKRMFPNREFVAPASC